MPLVVVSQDVFPEVAVELKRLDNPAVVGALRLRDPALPRARRPRRRDRRDDARAARSRRARDAGRVVVIPNWVDTTALVPRPRDNEWAREHGLVERFVVMHSGNIGHAQNLDALIRAATFLRDLDDLRIVLIGGGARRDELKELARLLEVDQVAVHGLPAARARSPTRSRRADVHVVGLARGLSGYVVPSRLYGILAVGRPVIVAADAESETARVVESVGCGVVVPPGRPGAPRASRSGARTTASSTSRRWGGAAASGSCARPTARVAVGRYRALLRELDGADGRP